MKNNRGQFFGLYLVFVTLFMCGVVIGLFYIQQGDIPSSLVSPKAILEIEDGLEIFEMREVRLMEEAFFAGEETAEFCTNEFEEEFMYVFIEGVLEDDKMKEFIFSSLTFNGRDIESDARADSRAFFEEILYSEGLGDCEDDKRVFVRSAIGKDMRLRGSDRNKISFPVDFSFTFEKKYTIDISGEVLS